MLTQSLNESITCVEKCFEVGYLRSAYRFRCSDCSGKCVDGFLGTLALIGSDVVFFGFVESFGTFDGVVEDVGHGLNFGVAGECFGSSDDFFGEGVAGFLISNGLGAFFKYGYLGFESFDCTFVILTHFDAYLSCCGFGVCSGDGCFEFVFDNGIGIVDEVGTGLLPLSS